LSKHGYALDAGVAKRRRALKAAVAEYGSSYVIKKLNVLAIYRKNDPKMKSHFSTLQADIAYVQRVRNGMSASKRTHNLETTRSRALTREY
jgi:hypothetical protein